jgi:hypothetical protein
MQEHASHRPIEKDISGIARRAAEDPEFLRRLQADPLGTAHSAGFRISWQEVRESLGMNDVPDEKMHETMRALLPRFKCTTTVET